MPHKPVMAEEGLAVDGEKYDIVDSFCYLGDMLSVDGWVDVAVAASVCVWKKLKELAPLLTYKAPRPKLRSTQHVPQAACCTHVRYGHDGRSQCKQSYYMIKLRRLDIRHFVNEESSHLANGCTAECGCIGSMLFHYLSHVWVE